MKARNTGRAIVLTERDRRLIAEVTDFGLMTREQIRRRLCFGSLTRVNATLLRLVRAGYLSRRFQPTLTGWRRALYYLGPAGAQLLAMSADCVSERRRLAQWSDLFSEHQLSVNDVRLAFTECQERGYRLERWLTESVLRELTLPVVPDAYVEYELTEQVFAAFLELDRGTESLTRWKQKTAGYMNFAFSGLYAERFRRRFFRVLVVTPSERRLEQLRREIARHTKEIFWLATFADVVGRGPFAEIWRRPADTALHPLTEA